MRGNNLPFALVGWVLLVVLIAGCSLNSEVSSTPPSTTEPFILELQDEPTSNNGWVQVGGLTFDLTFACFAPGAGDVVAVGTGDHPTSGQAVKVLVQGFLGQPYVGLMIAEEVALEAALEDPLEVYVHNDKITAGAIRWQKDLDLETGEGESAGFGALFVDCLTYQSGLPDGY